MDWEHRGQTRPSLAEPYPLHSPTTHSLLLFIHHTIS
ncbi:unnamed protein product [Onchocerca flexuosa]|uniref:Uncharacterized protein n=1 Tax=Onchocerca flexuosa TaxID=387005 RepID=A0A183I405_9BILA|nr:unnamed protein product [Onchocerca flexuosa]